MNRAPQLMRNARQHPEGEHKAIVMAQMEVVAGKVKPLPALDGLTETLTEPAESTGHQIRLAVLTLITPDLKLRTSE